MYVVSIYFKLGSHCELYGAKPKPHGAIARSSNNSNAPLCCLRPFHIKWGHRVVALHQEKPSVPFIYVCKLHCKICAAVSGVLICDQDFDKSTQKAIESNFLKCVMYKVLFAAGTVSEEVLCTFAMSCKLKFLSFLTR